MKSKTQIVKEAADRLGIPVIDIDMDTPIIFRYQLPSNMPIGKELSIITLTNKYNITEATITRNSKIEFTAFITAKKELPLVLEITPTLELTVYIKE